MVVVIVGGHNEPRASDPWSGIGQFLMPPSLADSKEPVVTRSPMEKLPDWEDLLAAAVRLQAIVPGSILVGGTAAALIAGHRRSMDADHVIPYLVDHFDQTLADLEAAAGWHTSRVRSPVVVMGSLDGILTTIRNQRRTAPLETVVVTTAHGDLVIPTAPEILRIKAWLALDRNAVRDYLDVAALATSMNKDDLLDALAPMDRLYPQDDPGAVRWELMVRLADPQPFDRDEVDLSQYKDLVPEWWSWSAVVAVTTRVSGLIADAIRSRRPGWNDVGSEG